MTAVMGPRKRPYVRVRIEDDVATVVRRAMWAETSRLISEKLAARERGEDFSVIRRELMLLRRFAEELKRALLEIDEAAGIEMVAEMEELDEQADISGWESHPSGLRIT